MSAVEYGYAEGPLLEERNTYFYSQYHGRPFLCAWMEQRENANLSLTEPCPPPDTQHKVAGYSLNQEVYEAGILFTYIRAEIERGVEPVGHMGVSLAKLTQRFEVTKRVYEAYDGDFKAVDKTTYKRLDLYVSFAELMEAAYQKTGKLPYMNVLLKVVDTLCAACAGLDEQAQGRLARLIEREKEFVGELMSKAGIEP